MNDRGAIAGGLVLFAGLITLPLWFNVAGGTVAERLALTLPAGEKNCVAPLEYMRASHMALLMEWREDVVRRGERSYVAFDGRTYTKSLTGTCLGCHVSRVEFCDRCHDYAGVKAACWECHMDRRPGQQAAR